MSEVSWMSWRFVVAVITLLVGLAGTAGAQPRVDVSGMVLDTTGAGIPEAALSLIDSERAVIGSTASDQTGIYKFAGVPPGEYVLRVAAPGFASHRQAVKVGRTGLKDLIVLLAVQGIEEEVTVTATRGAIEATSTIAQPVNVISDAEIWQRSKAIVAQVAAEEVGVQLQRTGPAIAGIFVRGLTGNKVNVFMDGVRFSTAAARGGINTFLDLIEPSDLDSVEILRGPNSAQYGSDAIGGSVQFISKVPSFLTEGRPFRGAFGSFFHSADTSFGSNLSASYAAPTFGVLVNVAGRRVNPVRPGGGFDSHAAVARFFGVRSDVLMRKRLPDTGFTQYGGMAKLNWAPTTQSQIIIQYGRGHQDGSKRYDQLLGGDGNLVADLRNLVANFFYVRYRKAGVGWFDQASVTYSLNTQREERVNQGGNGNPRVSINHEPERTRAHGVQVSLSKQIGTTHDLLMGGDFYPETIESPSYSFNPVTGVSTVRRPRIPDSATYRSGGIYIQDEFSLVPDRLRLMGGFRFSLASYRAREADSPVVNGRRLWPDDSLKVGDATFRVGAITNITRELSIYGNVSRGFRAPHMTDLGTLGLTGSGFEVAAPDVAGLGATVGSLASDAAVSTGEPVRQVGPETSLNYEAGVRYRGRSWRTDLAFFVNDVNDNITKQALILPPGASGLRLGGEPIIAQSASGVVFVAPSTVPVLVRTNFDDARLFGFEHTVDWQVSPAWRIGTVLTYVRARDKRTDLPPNIEGGTPAPDGYLRVAYAPPGKSFWIEPYIHAAARQGRLSTLDLEDRRTGATRSRSSIRSFFLNGATVRGWIGPGPDGILGTADDVLLATAETLAQIQNRVLGVGVDSAPLLTSIPGYVTANVRAGVRLGRRHELLIDFENIGDSNYRGISWGMDAPGRNLSVRYRTSF
ncbi:MAG: TonB-dependent receptor [Acidobacteria bacterium]|nr:TonB-dependent receptor [Acidobacteriota bacterium]